MRALWHIARADFLERFRRYSFLVMMAAVLWLAYLTVKGTIGVDVGEHYRGIFNSAWSGAVMTLMVTTFLTLAGFYVVKNCVRRDEETRVGQIIAATPIRKTTYVLGKAVSNFFVLSTLVAVLAVAGIAMQMWQGEDRHFELWKFIAPFLIVALPGVFVISCVAVFFECTPGLRGGFGNFAYFFGWSILLGASVQMKKQDLAGILMFQQNIIGALRRVHPEARTAFSVGGGHSRANLDTFVWDGMDWTAAILLSRVYWVLAALALVALAALIFHRFDPARMRLRLRGSGWSLFRIFRRKTETVDESDAIAIAPVFPMNAHLTPLPAAAPRFRFAQVVASELRLMLKGLPWLWWIGLGGLFIAALANSAKDTRAVVLPLTWIWTALIWSKMGTREARFRTGPLVFSSAHSITRQFPALYLAGVLVAVLTGGPAALRMLVARDINGLACWLAAALFIPAFALACGAWSGSSKLFEAIYVAWWYVGPMHATPDMDYIGVTAQSGRPLMYLGFAAALLAAAFLRRALQLRQGSLAFAA
ncbi:MAG: hypothetical protein M3P27_05100 [Acidobacteriota bacterium]|nr:hypothetical protein [Acidobacteriota bacterium]